MKTNYITILLFAGILLGCTNERMKLLSEAEKVLPGNWRIESVRLPKDGLGITYQGNTFIADTILFEVGSIEINNFSADTLPHLANHQHGKVKCNLTIGNEVFPIAITRLFISGDEIFSGFEYNGPHGTFPINTDGEKFFWSSRIFNDNYIITIINEDKVELGKSNDRHDHVITLNRL